MAGFTIPVMFYGAASWITVSETSLTTSRDGYGGYTCRVVIDAAEFSQGGTKVRLTFASSSSGAGFQADAVWIGESSTSGDVYDFASSPTEVLFSGGSGFTMTSGSETIVSDSTTYTLDDTKRQLVSFRITPGSYDDPATETTVTNYETYIKTADEEGVQDVTSYTADHDIFALTKIEVQ